VPPHPGGFAPTPHPPRPGEHPWTPFTGASPRPHSCRLERPSASPKVSLQAALTRGPPALFPPLVPCSDSRGSSRNRRNSRPSATWEWMGPGGLHGLQNRWDANTFGVFDSLLLPPEACNDAVFMVEAALSVSQGPLSELTLCFVPVNRNSGLLTSTRSWPTWSQVPAIRACSGVGSAESASLSPLDI